MTLMNTSTTSTSTDSHHPGPLQLTIIAGGLAGLAVDSILFPLDTIKTRSQCAAGFRGSGGFKGIFSGLAPTLAGSVPTAAIFFLAYEYGKAVLRAWAPDERHIPAVHMGAASAGEISACILRVPTEVVKQRLQAGQYTSTFGAIRTIYKLDGALGFYRGFFSTVLREIPFVCIQFPLYEYLKRRVALYHGRSYNQVPAVISSFESALCGSVAGAVAAALTTPLDVIKTRVILAQNQNIKNVSYVGIVQTVLDVWKHGGVRGFFRGVWPRVTWISLGGFIFLGTYEHVKKYLFDLSDQESDNESQV